MITKWLLAQNVLLVTALVGCTSPSDPSKPGAADDSASADSGQESDTGDTGERETLDVEPGPICGAESWPVATPWNVLAANVVAGLADDDMVADLQTLVDGMRAGEEHGPWEDVVRGPLRSSDGLDFGSQSAPRVVSQGSVPAVTRGADGDVWLFFVDGDLDRLMDAAETGTPLTTGIVGVGGLGAARSSDGADFERVDIAFTGDVPLYIVDPDIQTLPDGTWRMTYFGVPIDRTCADKMDPISTALPHQAYTAVSSDLVNWTHEGVAFDAENRGADPTVWCEDALNCMVFMGGGGVSTDGGVTYAQVEMVPPDPGPNTPDVIGGVDGWRMYYLEGTKLVSALSADGLNWTREGDRNIAGADPTVMDVEGEVWMYYKAKAQN
jgi:hypothetical protein